MKRKLPTFSPFSALMLFFLLMLLAGILTIIIGLKQPQLHTQLPHHAYYQELPCCQIWMF